MSDKHRYRPRSPPLAPLGRTSLPVFGYNYDGYSVPSRREYSTASSTTAPRTHERTAPPIVTTYKIQADPQRSTSSVREGSRTRRSTLDSLQRPIVVPVPPSPRHRTTVHGGAGRPPSPSLQNPARASDDSEFWVTPATSHKKHHHHKHHHRNNSASGVDQTDLSRVARESAATDRLRPSAGGRDSMQYYPSRSSRQSYQMPTRRPDNISADYGTNGYGYTNMRDLVQYDLNNPPRRSRREGHSRPSSISSYGDLLARPQESREHGPPPSTRGFDKIAPRASVYEVAPVRPAREVVPVRPTHEVAPVRSAQPVPPVDAGRLRTEPYESDSQLRPPSRSNSTRRPVSLYHDDRRSHRDDYYEVRDPEPRDRRDRDRTTRNDRYEERYDDRYDERYDDRYDDGDKRTYDRRAERREYEKRDRDRDRDRDRESKHGGTREALATGLSLAAGALGLTAAGSSSRDEKSDRDRDRDRERERERERDREKDRDDYNDDRRRREHTSRRKDRRDDRDVTSSEEEKSRVKESSRDKDSHHRDRRRYDDDDSKSKAERRPVEETRQEKSETVAHDTLAPPIESIEAAPERSRSRTREPLSSTPFNPNNTMDLRALKDALNAQDKPAVKEPVLASSAATATSASSVTMEPSPPPAFDPRAVDDIQTVQAELNARENRGRRSSVSAGPSTSSAMVRVVSPPRDKGDDKPLKGILRQPREKFPEDPAPIREGVAPLKDAKKDGIPPDARWTKISRQLVNPEALEAGKERYESRDDFVIVLRVLSREEIQAYAAATQQIRAARDEDRDRDRRRRHRHRREDRDRERTDDHVHDATDRDRDGHKDRDGYRSRHRDDSSSGSSSTDDDGRPRLLEDGSRKRSNTMDDPTLMSGGLEGDAERKR